MPLYFDYIVATLFRLFPNKFSMATFTQYPDTYRINNAIRRIAGSLSDKKKTSWITGSVENGFYINETGREVAKQVKNFIKNPSRHRKAIAKERSRGRSPLYDVKEITDSILFRRWQNNDLKISNYDVLSFLKAMPYTPKNLLLQYLENLKQSSNTVKNQDVSNFLKWIEEKFYNMFH